MESIRIVKAESKKDLKKFILFPWKIYRNDSNWVPPLLMDMKEKLNRNKNPFFEQAQVDLFLAYKDEKLFGRVAAIHDEQHNEFHKEKIVFFGLYESYNDRDVAFALMEEVSRWGREKGMDTLRGPVNLSMNDECSFLLEGFNSPPVIMMPYNPSYYLELMEKCGLIKAKDLYAFFMTRKHKEKDKVQTIIEKIKRETSITLRTVNLKNVEEEARRIAFIYNDAWKDNWGFVPWTENE
ncbi:MAG: hypothetical protein ACOC57_03255, partial [Acidobacteriota bacterium]